MRQTIGMPELMPLSTYPTLGRERQTWIGSPVAIQECVSNEPSEIIVRHYDNARGTAPTKLAATGGRIDEEDPCIFWIKKRSAGLWDRLIEHVVPEVEIGATSRIVGPIERCGVIECYALNDW